MNVILVYPNIHGYHSDVYNFGLAYIASVLKANGHTVKLEVIESKKDYRKLLRSMQLYRPGVVGFTSVSSQFPYVKEMASLIKAQHNCVVVCGGIHPTIFPECLIESSDLDGLFVGESEFSFLEFVNKVMRGEDYKDNDNFCYRKNGALVKNRLKQRTADLDEFGFPDRQVYDYQKVIDRQQGMVSIMCMRGCPFQCSYCSNHAIAKVYGQERNMIRYRSVDNCIAEIREISNNYSFKTIWFIDDLFIMNKGWLSEFLNRYKSEFNFPFMCNLRLDLCTKEIVAILKGAGCYKVLVAVESANDRIRREVMNRTMSKEAMRNSVSWLKEAGIQVLVSNIIGVPGETEDTIRETIEFNKALNPTIAAVNIFFPYNGTVLGDYCRKNNLVKSAKRDICERQESILNLKTVSARRLKYYYNNFSYLVFKDIDRQKAKKIRQKNIFFAIYRNPVCRGMAWLVHKSNLSKTRLYKALSAKIWS